MEPQLPEAWDQGDEWRGITSAKERRKRQNRLHQRAYRKKRHLRALAQHNVVESDTNTAVEVVSSASSQQIVRAQDAPLIWPMSHPSQLPFFLQVIKCMGRSQQVLEFLQRAYFHWSLNHPVPGDLPALTRLNAFGALIRNASILQIPVECLETDDCSSPFITLRPDNALESPDHLCPTELQRTVAHHAWLDLFPFPGLRDNILHSIQSGQYDEDYLCDELCCDLMNLEAKSTASVVIWGDSWDARGWEFSADFFDKWEMLLQGCSEILQATNYWREKRKAMKLDFVLNP
ncbi:hypothetical protein B0T10DRAFT_479139 [Thelonectria olida]|uniref:BZIP domain-containing protein n=1 Tax=Thelonectria olida TaxID=1576542 RepID=A0A9P9AUN8_9HYPO|nr:hypothetical protein B0T10DRAFT_479139 [Thelonectria olida]